jgi:hypothetical protein
MAIQRPHLIRDLNSAQLTFLFDRLLTLRCSAETMGLVRTALKGNDESTLLLDSLAKFDGTIKRSDLAHFCDVPGESELVEPGPALRLLKAANWNLTDPDVLERLARKHIRFDVVDFIGEVDATKEELLHLFPFLFYPLWTPAYYHLVDACLDLKWRGREAVVSALWDLPQMKEFYGDHRVELFHTLDGDPRFREPVLKHFM